MHNNRSSKPQFHRRSTPKVKNGKVQRKNREVSPRPRPLVRREQPGPGYRHVVRKRDIDMFVRLLPSWDYLSTGLCEIVLAAGDEHSAGWYTPGTVAICAWRKGEASEQSREFVDEHASLYRRLGIPYVWKSNDEAADDGYYLVHLTDETIRAFQLLHILLHELGHHHDAVTARKKFRSHESHTYSESYAEEYALLYEAVIFERYCEDFDFHVAGGDGQYTSAAAT